MKITISSGILLAATLLALGPTALPAARYTGEPEIQAKPLSPTEALKSFRLDSGLRIELVASEPMITDPVDIAFDEAGRMYVVENNGYNRETAKPRSRIRRLEDTDGDGKMDRGMIVAEDLDYAQGVLCVKGGLIVTTNTGILFLRDLDGDGRTDRTDVLFKCAPSIHIDRQMSAPRRGIDNWIYINLGLFKQELTPTAAPDRPLTLTSNFRYHPGTGAFEASAGAGQFGKAFDDWGRQFFSTNRNPGLFAVLPLSYLSRNPAAFLTRSEDEVVRGGNEGKVYPLKNFRTTSSAHAGTFTAACGTGVYRGDWLDREYAGNLFVCEPTGALITRWMLEPAGPSFTTRRATPGREFLASNDEWFRPVNTATGPDGAFYVVDMYRRFLDGSRFFPDDFVATNDMGSGSDRGRIYRIVPAASAPRAKFTPIPPETAKRVALLEHTNGWQRDTAQRLLVESGAAAAIPALENLLRMSRSAPARLHALWTIEGLNGLKARHVETALNDAEASVVENALWLAPRFLATAETIRRRVYALTADARPRLRFAALLATGALEGGEAERALVQAGVRDAGDAWMRTAILSSPLTRSGRVLTSLLEEPEFRSRGSRGDIELVNSLAIILAAGGKPAELKPALVALSAADNDGGGAWWKMAVLGGISEGLRRQTGDGLPKSVSALLANPPPELSDALTGVRRAAGSAGDVLKDRTRPISERLAAVALLEHLPKEEAVTFVAPLMNRREPVAIQQAMVDILRHLNRGAVSPVLYANLAEMGTVARTGAIQYLQQSPAELLKNIQAGRLSPALVDANGRWGILNSKDDNVRALGQEIFGRTEGDRKQLVRRYTAALKDFTGSAAQGKAIFQQTCTVCHRFRGEGNDVGPDITDVRIKTPEMLLSDILDPNHSIEPRWEAHTMQVEGGRTLVGIIVTETNDALVVRGLTGTETLPRSSIQASTSLGVSLMPEGLEGTLNEPRMADLLAFLRSDPEKK
ncbi:MAG: c-type cytochrome [Opitutus sp.]|nr:c-type cytochrome [Opitutus sp.]